jgi:hypothetical protein
MSDQTQLNNCEDKIDKSYELYKSQYMSILSKNKQNISFEKDANYIEYVKYMKYIEYLSMQEEERLFQEILKERRRLYALGLYELEEGEILE